MERFAPCTEETGAYEEKNSNKWQPLRVGGEREEGKGFSASKKQRA